MKIELKDIYYFYQSLYTSEKVLFVLMSIVTLSVSGYATYNTYFLNGEIFTAIAITSLNTFVNPLLLYIGYNVIFDNDLSHKALIYKISIYILHFIFFAFLNIADFQLINSGDGFLCILVWLGYPIPIMLFGLLILELLLHIEKKAYKKHNQRITNIFKIY